MTYLIAAAGTGGHIYPGLAVGEALVAAGAAKDDVLFVGGDRLEATVYPGSGFPFLQTAVRGLQRSARLRSITLPAVIWEARSAILAEIRRRGTRVALGMGGYATVPTGMSAVRAGIPFMLAEQNAEAGLANRVSARWAHRQFVSFPNTRGLKDGEWVGNPVRRPLAYFDRDSLRAEARTRYELGASVPVLGVYGGSLGAGVINEAVASLVADWTGEALQVVQVTGRAHIEGLTGRAAPEGVTWRLVDFEDRMDLFFAASDLVVARSGGGVAELTATGTPAILVPGDFGSSGHQAANAAFIEDAGAAVIVRQDELDSLATAVSELLFDGDTLASMSRAAEEIAHPRAATTIAAAMIEMSR